MTLQELFTLVSEHRTAIVLLILFAPWITWLICVAIPGQREEPLLLSLNLGLAVGSLLIWAGYLAYANYTGGWSKVVREADLLLLMAPIYYVGLSLWIARQRLPLERIPAFRMIQGLATIAAAYLGLSWFLAKIRIIFFSYLPFGFFLFFVAILLALAYLGYLRLLGKNLSNSDNLGQNSGTTMRGNQSPDPVEDELKQLRRQMGKRKR